MGILYFIKDSDEFTKIGITKNLKRRLRELNCGVSNDLIVIKTFDLEHYKKIERFLQNLYITYKVRGEWFNLSEEMLEDIYDRVELLDINFGEIRTSF
tara:strand:- start:1393 stop:1686 length:294 start_codon:yes stop_codon:yes gene_type:complete